MSTAAFEINGLAACLGLGIHAVGPGLRPVPILVDNAMRIDLELRKGLQVSEETHDRFEDFCAELNNMCLSLTDNWIGSRFGYRSENTVVLKVAGGSDSHAMSHSLRQLNHGLQLALVQGTGGNAVNITSYNVTDVGYHYIGLRVLAGLPSGTRREEQTGTISRSVP